MHRNHRSADTLQSRLLSPYNKDTRSTTSSAFYTQAVRYTISSSPSTPSINEYGDVESNNGYDKSDEENKVDDVYNKIHTHHPHSNGKYEYSRSPYPYRNPSPPKNSVFGSNSPSLSNDSPYITDKDETLGRTDIGDEHNTAGASINNNNHTSGPTINETLYSKKITNNPNIPRNGDEDEDDGLYGSNYNETTVFNKLKEILDIADVQFMFMVAGLTTSEMGDFVDLKMDPYEAHKMKKRKNIDPIDTGNAIYKPAYSSALIAARQSLYIRRNSLMKKLRDRKVYMCAAPADYKFGLLRQKRDGPCTYMPTLTELMSHETLRASFAQLVAFHCTKANIMNGRTSSLDATLRRLRDDVVPHEKYLIEAILGSGNRTQFYQAMW